MTSRRATKRRRAEKADEWLGVVAGWCAGDDDLEEAKKRSHDLVIDMLGSRRRGGVRWQIARGADATTVLDKMTEGELDPVLLDHYRRIRGLLRENGGIVVLAMAPGVR
jgi:hypothetical protein